MSLSRSTGSTPEKRPSLFIDHSLGTVRIPRFFRDVGFEVTTVKEAFGRPDIEDEVWLEYVSDNGMVAVCKDAKIRTRPNEVDALLRHSVRMFCLSNGNLGGVEQVEYFRRNLSEIDKLWNTEGPWLFGVQRNGIRRYDIGRL